MVDLCVVGAGPKGVALACKCASLREAGYKTVPRIFVVEQEGVGSTWTGRSGYTDGKQLLCTPAKRDLGFPYQPSLFGQRAANILHREYSWSAFCLDSTTSATIADWVSRGQLPPSHSLFARYLKWALKKAREKYPADIEQIAGTFKEMTSTASGWEVCIEQKNSRGATLRRDCDGVVVTGSISRRTGIRGAPPTTLNGKTFWEGNLEVFRSTLVRDQITQILIVGSGGTAAAIAAWFVASKIPGIEVQIVGRQPTLHARDDNFFEDRLFSDDEAWGRIPVRGQELFLTRLTRGTVWSTIARELAASETLNYTCDEIVSAQVTGTGRAAACTVTGSRSPIPYSAQILIDATGFDDWWFVQSVADATAKTALEAVRSSLKDPADPDRVVYAKNFDKHLCMTTPNVNGGLHLPMLAGFVGPAASNLMALGWMSDRIISRYVDPQEMHAGIHLP